ncbi:MAG: hypothetical protein AB1485_06315 [Candidatus Thermoplasmatota archaeon]
MRNKIIAILVAISMLSFAGLVLAGDVPQVTDESSTLSVECRNIAPVINVIDLRTVADASKLNAKIDVLTEYYFFVNITDANSWVDIEYVNITAWYDNGTDPAAPYNSQYNTTWAGAANDNFFLQYKNTTGTASWSVQWPATEVTIGTCTDTILNTTCHELKFYFTLKEQIRHTAPADFGVTEGLYYNNYNNTFSWNFNVSAGDTAGDRAFGVDEFGVYMYTAISSVGSPSMSGYPGDSVSAGAIDIVTKSNGNFSLSVATIGELVSGANTLDNATCSVAGGDIAATALDPWPVYIYGSSTTYKRHSLSGTSLTTALTYSCNIPLAQPAGTYTATLRYILTTEQ